MAKASREPNEKDVDLANVCRHLASLVDGVMPEIVSSFASTDPKVRAARLSEYVNGIISDAFPFLTWLERNKHPGIANLEKARLFQIADEAVACAESDQPQFAGGKISEKATQSPLTADQKRLGELVVITMREAASLRNWSKEIDKDLSGQNSRVRAHAQKLFPNGVPEDVDLRDVIVKLANERNDDNTDIQLIRDFYGETIGKDTKSRSMQGRIRAYRQRGGTTLPRRD